MLNVGVRPTVSQTGIIRLEVNILILKEISTGKR